MGIPLRADPTGVMRAERTSWQRAIAAHVLATNHRGDPAKIVRTHWADDQRALLITRGAVTQTTSTGGYPTFDPVAAFRSLAPSSAALALFQMGMALDLTGATTIRIPNAAGSVQPVFVGEGAPAPTVQGNFAVTVLGPVKKILLLSCVTAELENSTPDTVSAIIGRVLADTATIGIDNAAFGTQAADAVQPAGLLHNVTPIAAATAGADAIQKDLGNLTEAIGETGIDPNGAVFVCGPREATISAQQWAHALTIQFSPRWGFQPKPLPASHRLALRRAIKTLRR